MNEDRPPDPLERTLAAAVRDGATVRSDGRSLQPLIHGVTIRRLTTHTDFRGTVTELIDSRWREFPHPLVFSYSFTIRPGVAKGWGLHRRHEDRYAMLQGELDLVLFDPRPDSPTCGKVSRITLSEHDRCLVNIPIDVWHADHNIGARDAVVVNFPTIAYEHDAPDKWRLPLDTPLIPYRFPAGTKGG